MFSNNKVAEIKASKDVYMRGYVANLYLRPSCYQCAFKNFRSGADITLGDFWGIENLLPEMDDNKGTSLLLVHTAKGIELWNAIKEKCAYQACDMQAALQYNQSAIKAANKPANREQFWDDLEKLGAMHTFNKYCSVSMYRRLIAKIKRTIGR